MSRALLLICTKHVVGRTNTQNFVVVVKLLRFWNFLAIMESIHKYIIMLIINNLGDNIRPSMAELIHFVKKGRS